MIGYIFAGLVAFIIAGWLWFFVARPILEDYQVGALLSRLFNGPLRPAIDWRPVKYSRRPRRPRYRVMSRPKVASAPVSMPVVSVSDTAITPVASNNLTEDQLIELLARHKNARGKYTYSGKKLYGLFGGNYNDFVAKIRAIRGDEEPPQPHGKRLDRPANGW